MAKIILKYMSLGTVEKKIAKNMLTFYIFTGTVECDPLLNKNHLVPKLEQLIL